MSDEAQDQVESTEEETMEEAEEGDEATDETVRAEEPGQSSLGPVNAAGSTVTPGNPSMHSVGQIAAASV